MTSSYFQSLDPPTQKQYREKIELLGQVDPYDIQECDLAEDVESLPEVTYSDIVNYFIFTPSPYTSEDMKAYKSLEAYNQVLNGWVRDVRNFSKEDYILVIGKVGF